MPQILAALLAGLVFGLGLTISQMINPAKVLGFLDIAGDWDPSLAIVMAAAVVVAAAGMAIGRQRGSPLLADRFALPAATGIDRRLVIGALLFGIGWGLVGFCPGPALAALGVGGVRTLIFVGALLIGMLGFAAMQRARSR